MIELPRDANEPVAAAPLSAEDRIRMEATLKELQAREREIITERQAMRKASGGKPPKNKAAQADLGRIVTVAKHLETELAAHNKDGSTKALAMGVVDEPLPAMAVVLMPGRRNGFGMRPNRPGAQNPNRPARKSSSADSNISATVRSSPAATLIRPAAACRAACRKSSRRIPVQYGQMRADAWSLPTRLRRTIIRSRRA